MVLGKTKRAELPALSVTFAAYFQQVDHFISDPAGIRTQDPYIKSVMLYQLSYGI